MNIKSRKKRKEKKERERENDEEWTNKGIFSVAYINVQQQQQQTRERVIGPDRPFFKK
jgi:hypothetical protein